MKYQRKKMREIRNYLRNPIKKKKKRNIETSTIIADKIRNGNLTRSQKIEKYGRMKKEKRKKNQGRKNEIKDAIYTINCLLNVLPS